MMQDSVKSYWDIKHVFGSTHYISHLYGFVPSKTEHYLQYMDFRGALYVFTELSTDRAGFET